jgi:periplasmic divalent cation tolerance protein
MPQTLIYITASSVDEATAIGRSLVDERLAACANVLPGSTSIYHWQGAIAEGRECALIAKTTPQRVDALIVRVKALHSYDCPCIVALPITAGNPEFLEWITTETTKVSRLPSVQSTPK